MTSVNRYIRQKSGSNFQGSWMLVVEWKDVSQYQSNIDEVCAIILSLQKNSVDRNVQYSPLMLYRQIHIKV